METGYLNPSEHLPDDHLYSNKDILTNSSSVFQIKSFIMTMLSKLEGRDLTKLIQLSSVMSLVMDDPEEIKPDVLVSRSPPIIV